jgi:hypothetical protein
MLDPRTVADNLLAEFSSIFGDELRSVVLYGSVARGDSIPGVSDVNTLVLLESLTPSDLARMAPLACEWVRAGNTPPLTLSWDEWAGMRDTFAIEVSDMLDAREVVHGADPLHDEPTVDPRHLRLHTERELRRTMLELRARMLLSVNEPQELGRLLLSGIPSFAAYMRVLLRLRGAKPPPDTESVIQQAAHDLGADGTAMLRCQEARRRLEVPSVQILDPLVREYTDFAHRLQSYIDEMAAEVDTHSTDRTAPQVTESSR